jgi:hypothetical protein
MYLVQIVRYFLTVTEYILFINGGLPHFLTTQHRGDTKRTVYFNIGILVEHGFMYLLHLCRYLRIYMEYN